MLEWILSSAVLTAIVIVLRCVLKGRMSLRLQYALWAIVLLRLLVPVSFGSAAWSVQNLLDRPPAGTPKAVYTVMNGAKTDTPEAVVEISGFTPDGQTADAQNVGVNIQIEQGASQSVREGLRIEATPAGERSLGVSGILLIVWFSFAGAIALWLLIANLHFYGKLRRSRERLEIDDAPLPVFVSDRIDTPCLFGLIKPKIYVTPEVVQDVSVLRCAIEHEATHYRHGDHIWSILRGLCLALHWFDPFVWIAAVMSRNDAELACDEATIQRIGEEHRAEYGRTLIQLTCEKRPAVFVAATTMTGSGRSIKERIRLIVKKPKTAVLTLFAIVLVVAIAVGCTFTGAKTEDTEQPAQTSEKPEDTDLPKAEQDIPEDATVIGQAVYCGYLYDVPDVTTGIAFYEDQMFFDAVLIPSTETPRQSLECNVPGTTASFAVYHGDLILIVDGTQYDLANKQKIVATQTTTEPSDEGPANADANSVIGVSDSVSEIYRDEAMSPVLAYARDYVAQAIAGWNDRTGNLIEEAQITGITRMNTGTAALDHRIDMYLLEYRLLPSDQENIALAEGMQTVEKDGLRWITEQGSGGQPYLVLLCADGDVWLRIGTIDTATVERRYGTPEMLDIYGNAYTAATMQMFQESGAMYPARAVKDLFESGEITLTLYLVDGSAWKTFAAKDPQCEDRFWNTVHSFRWTRADAPSAEPSEYRITAVSADGTKRMTFCADSGAGSIEYCDGDAISLWRAQRDDQRISVAGSIRDIYDGLEVDFSRISFRFDGSAEKAAGYFVTTAVGEHLHTLAPGSSYGVDDYEVIEWNVTSVSTDGKSVEGSFSCAFVPWDPGDPETGRAGNLRAGNTQDGTGQYAGKLVFYRNFVLQLQDDGAWHCSGFSTG